MPDIEIESEDIIVKKIDSFCPIRIYGLFRGKVLNKGSPGVARIPHFFLRG